MQRILLAGATGNLGPHLAKGIIDAGHQLFTMIRPETIRNEEKLRPLRELGAQLIEADLNNPQSLDRACKNMDIVVSALGGGQILQQEELLKAALKNKVRRFIPSEFGVNPYASERGTCDLFDAKYTFQQKIKEYKIPYTMIYTNAFMEFWASGLGQLGNNPTTGKVDLYENGNVKAAFISLPDLAKFTAEIITDPAMESREVCITANAMTQEDLITCWEEISESRIQRNRVSDSELLHVINSAKLPEEMMNRIFTQLHRSVWIKGDTLKKLPGVVEATQAYPHIPVTSVEAFYKGMMEMA